MFCHDCSSQSHCCDSGFLFGLLLFSFSPRHIAVVAIVPDQLLVFVGDVRSESRNPIQDGERARNVSLGPGSF
jgi:hypothetical protein